MKRWSESEAQMALELAARSAPIAMICRTLGRSEHSVRSFYRWHSIPYATTARSSEERRRDHLWDMTWRRLASRYSPERADAIMDGRDPATQADLAAWRSRGHRSAA